MNHATDDLLTNASNADSVLACSRCDGPVSERDLVDGNAVRIDSQPVCQLCIETLPAGLRVQINRARALKGLAVTTYRVQHPTIREAVLFSFTNAGLLMMHRRALISRTDFITPELPTEKRPLHGSSAAATTTAHQLISEGKRGRLLLILSAAAVVVIGGIIGLVMASSPKPKQVATPVRAHSPAPALTIIESVSTPLLIAPESLPTPLPTPQQTTSNHAVTWSEYLINYRRPLEALNAAEQDHASADICERLKNEVIRTRTVELDKAVGYIRNLQFAKARELLEQTKIPAERNDFADLLTEENEIRLSLTANENSTKTLPPSPVVLTPVQVQVSVPAPESVAKPDTVVESPRPSDEDPSASISSVKTAKPRVRLTQWNGPPLPIGSSYSTMDPADNIPAPWPTMAKCSELQFIKSVLSSKSGSTGISGKKSLHQLTFNISSAQVLNGGIAVNLYINYKRKDKIMRFFCDDQPLKEEVFTTSGWQLILLPLPPGATSQISLRIEDTDELPKDGPFWVGPLILVEGAAPTAENAQALPPTIVADDVNLIKQVDNEYVQFFNILLPNRGLKNISSAIKGLPFNEAKFLLADWDDRVQDNLSEHLRGRWTTLEKLPKNTIESWSFLNPEPLESLKDKPSKNQTFLVMIPNGNESTLGAQEWEKRVRLISKKILEPPKPQNACIPIWVMGSLDGRQTVDQAVWSKVNVKNDRWVVIDLTAGGTMTATATKAYGPHMIADALKTLSYQLRQTLMRAATK